MPLEKQVAILYAAINGLLDDIPVDEIIKFESDFHSFIEANHPELGKAIAETKDIDEKTGEALKKAIMEFKKGHYTGQVLDKEPPAEKKAAEKEEN
jgi:F-type H+-transporting ATPase subunit alpha